MIEEAYRGAPSYINDLRQIAAKRLGVFGGKISRIARGEEVRESMQASREVVVSMKIL